MHTNDEGLRDRNTARKPDANTIYPIISLSKTFVVACLGILVDQGKIRWADRVGQYLPTFCPEDDHQISEAATFNDFLRHSSGIANPVVPLFGPNGKVLVPQRDFIDVINKIPSANSEGQSDFNKTWKYSNIAYGLLTIVIENLSGTSYARFLHDNILTPLGMHHTATSDNQIKSSDNIAHSYAILSDDAWHELNYEWTTENNSPFLGMVGIRSSGKCLRSNASLIASSTR